MKSKVVKKILSIGLCSTLMISMAACGNSGTKTDTGSSSDSNSDSDVGTDTDAGTEASGNTEVPTIDQIKVGEDYTDITADLKFLTHKTDVVDTLFSDYVAEFKKIYPNVNIEYEGITSYADDIVTRLTTGDWGDICMVPVAVDKNELSSYFTPFGDAKTLGESYDMLTDYTYQNQVFGMPSMANAQGIVYNKAVFEQAGITELPKTPDAFIDALKTIKEKTDAIPLYTNFAAGWTMTAWDAYIDGSATGDPDFANVGRTKGKNPYADRGDQTGPYAVYNVLYEAVNQGLVEDDPTTTDWEGSKGMLNRGEVATLALGSWAVSQVKEAGDNADDVGYMTFPISVGGKQYAAAGADYNYGINCNSSTDDQIAAMCYVKWLVEKSGFAASQGGISVVKGDPLPDALAAFEGVELVVNNPPAEGEETLVNDVNNESELGINVSGAVPSQVVEAAIDGSKTMQELSDDWNARWTAAQEKFGITN
ncbi:ABC transporter substrate-binding protein [Lachnospiraceae bacterium ZAX-1]